MNQALRAITIFVLAALGGCGGMIRVEPGDMVLAPNSREAVVVMRIIPTSMQDQTVVIGKYNPQSQQMVGSNFDQGSMAEFGAREASALGFASQEGREPKFVARVINPGTYAYWTYREQKHWGLCFHRDTLSFTIKPGQLLFLGSFDVNPHGAELQNQVLQHNDDAAMKNMIYYYFEDVSPPRILLSGVNDPFLAEAKRYVATSMPGVRAEIQPAAYARTKFDAGRGILGQRICGSFFRDDAQEKKAGPQ